MDNASVNGGPTLPTELMGALPPALLTAIILPLLYIDHVSTSLSIYELIPVQMTVLLIWLLLNELISL